MKKIINDPRNFVEETVEGIISAYSKKVKCADGDLRCLVRSVPKKSNKVALATGGGSGHLPLFLGYVGQGMLDGCAVGNVFASPSSSKMLKVTEYIDNGSGVLYIYGNYSGDKMNFNMAANMAESKGIKVEQVIGNDDVASAENSNKENRRGIAGIFYIYKIAGACAEEGYSLDEVKRIAQKTCFNVRTLGVGLSPCIIPEVSKPTFEIRENEMEIGVGIHGEPGMGREKLKKSDEIVEYIMNAIIKDLPFRKGDEISVLVNGLGATPREELFIVFRMVSKILYAKGINIYNTYIDEFATSMEMAGMSISLLKLDNELKSFLKKSANTPFFQQEELI